MNRTEAKAHVATLLDELAPHLQLALAALLLEKAADKQQDDRMRYRIADKADDLAKLARDIGYFSDSDVDGALECAIADEALAA